MLTSPSRDDCSPGHAPELARDLLRRGVRLTAQLRVSAAGLALGPTLDERLSAAERARERLLQLEYVGERYAELTGADLLGDSELLLGSFEPPHSWPEASLAQLVLCLAARVELESTQLAAAAPDAIACETEHMNAACAALDELGALEGPLRGRVQDALPRWLTIAYATLDPAQAVALARAIEAVLPKAGLQISH